MSELPSEPLVSIPLLDEKADELTPIVGTNQNGVNLRHLQALNPSNVHYNGRMVQSITAEKAHELLSHEALDVIDVREPLEWSAGHLPQARLVPLARFRENPRGALGSDGVIFVCAAGVRSETAARLAVASGYRRVYNLSGGTRAWLKAGL